MFFDVQNLNEIIASLMKYFVAAKTEIQEF